MALIHTPGPWVDDEDYVCPADDLPLGICVVLPVDRGGPKDFFDGPVTKANRRLITACTDLLNALQAEQEWRCRDEAGELDPEWDYETMVGSKRRAALAKATGEAA